MMKMMDHAFIIETTSTRNDLTKYGLHLNMTSVERMANLTGNKIKTQSRENSLLLYNAKT
jgi:hypothetical protein